MKILLVHIPNSKPRWSSHTQTRLLNSQWTAQDLTLQIPGQNSSKRVCASTLERRLHLSTLVDWRKTFRAAEQYICYMILQVRSSVSPPTWEPRNWNKSAKTSASPKQASSEQKNLKPGNRRLPSFPHISLESCRYLIAKSGDICDMFIGHS